MTIGQIKHAINKAIDEYHNGGDLNKLAKTLSKATAIVEWQCKQAIKGTKEPIHDTSVQNQ